ncbi:sulfatase-like hydrolase/transferase [Psychrosphaera sp. 1_MG-2023]|uniref:sulfatase-like hydrolase/transferase n=1 Tax=Psychrosphaera sp. 1_MG-2023 TaxID=3062643 RepID=UPI0026E41812|nr:sulfatase-like hydrolase/transferase [Psychrosphaera sp. 1_MG-2023]MDO6718737.1 sulfatase-like hydrolase/transferase [Psychrosphaera sp. 1_MG-2023]
MKNFKHVLKIASLYSSLSLLLFVKTGFAEQRPNILWLTFEDTSAYELSLYGNKDAKQPNIDALAASSLVFQQATSNAPYCSPARSTLISGNYATSYGADHHRAAVDASPSRMYFPSLLKDAGYFTSNNKKRDYNVKLSKTELAQIWSEFDKKATYNSPKRKSDQPFFSVFNGHMTHMSRLTSYTSAQRRDFSQSAGVSSDAKPDYLPDLPEVKSDHQFHLEGVVDVDSWVKFFIDDLKAKGLYEDTIIFVYSDHGGSSPMGKGFLSFRHSLQVPLVIHVPTKFKHLVPTNVETLQNKQVSFVDFGPTVLSLAGIPTPKEMRGQAFLGELENHTRQYNHSFRTNQEDHFDPWRGVSDGRYHFVQTYLKRKPIMLRNDFQWGMPSNIALDEFAKTKSGQVFRRKYYSFKRGEYLYDTKTDPLEQTPLRNLTAEQIAVHSELTAQVSRFIRETKDLGFVPVEFKKDKQFEQWLAADFNYNKLYDLVELVSTVSLNNVPELTKLIDDKSPVIRFWAVQGFAELAAQGVLKSVPKRFIEVANKDHSAVSAVALETLVYLEQKGAVEALIKNDSKLQKRSALETIAYLRPELLLSHVRRLEQSNLNKTTVKVIKSALGVIKATAIASKKQLKDGIAVNKERRELYPLPSVKQK